MVEAVVNNRLENLAEKWVLDLYGLACTTTILYSFEDINFLVKTPKRDRFVLKLSTDLNSKHDLLGQNQLLQYLIKESSNPQLYPKPISGLDGNHLYTVNTDGRTYFLRLLTFLEGNLLSEYKANHTILVGLGQVLGELNKSLLNLRIDAFKLKQSPWDLKNALTCLNYVNDIKEPYLRRLVKYFMQQYQAQVVPKYEKLPQGIIHGDANDHNILVDKNGITGLIDFGDVCHSHLVHELAIAITYMMMVVDDPIKAACDVALGYYQQRPLSSLEFEVLYYLVGARLCTSLCHSSHKHIEDPSNEYYTVHQELVKEQLSWLISINPLGFRNKVQMACGLDLDSETKTNELILDREHYLSGALSLSYKAPLVIVGGAMQYLYDENGDTYLDCVNNISHLGHCHPEVVSAANQQMMRLNTNTRYLYPQLTDYAKAICDTLPEALCKVFFVNSGTEANELALRLARTHTGYQDMLVMESGYHGNSSSTIDISPYKYRGKGGQGNMNYIHEFPMPDYYAGKYSGEVNQSLPMYLNSQKELIEKVMQERGGFAGFICESLLGCGGQVVLPEGYLDATYQQVRANGGVCIADEVQVGFGRVGTHFWGFETQHVVPDIVTMGKPIGNGHPMAAVVTTPQIAQSFETGMEYFNSFGGNPVSCAIGLAVLESIKEEGLQRNALEVGEHLKSALHQLERRHTNIGEVRGLGLFIGIELVKSRNTKEPAPELASLVVEEMKKRKILLSIDGPRHNVIKIKPPMVFTEKNAEHLAQQLDEVLEKKGKGK